MATKTTLTFTKEFTKGLLKDLQYPTSIEFTGYGHAEAAKRHLLGVQANIERGKLNFKVLDSKIVSE